MLAIKKNTLPAFGGALLTAVLAFWALNATIPDASGRQGTGTAQIISCRDGRVAIRMLPFTIDECGSYFVAACLRGVSGEHGITIDADDVTLDLNGFTLEGVSGSLDGIHVTAGRSGVAIFGGTVRDWGGDGVDAFEANGVRLSDLSAQGNGDFGIQAGDGSTIKCCIARQNEHGIRARKASRLVDCTSAFNAFDGFVIGTANVVSDCVTESNGDDGFSIQGTNHVRQCIAMKNGDFGFSVTAVANRLEDNLAASNNGGAFQVTAGGNFLIRNSASGFGATYSIVPGNTFGQILANPGDGFVNDNPWANFKF